MKKRITLILGTCVSCLALITGGIVMVTYSSQKNTSTDNHAPKTTVTKDNLYYDYITNILESAIKNNDEILDCKININHSNNTATSANIKITTIDNELNPLKTDIRDYISQSLSALEISPENIIYTK